MIESDFEKFAPTDIERETTNEILSGFETAKIAENMYNILGPELGCRLVEANIVLTLAGLKGMADIHLVKLDESKIEKIEKLNHMLEKSKIKLNYFEKTDDSSKPVQLLLRNSAFKENTRIPGTSDFDLEILEEGKNFGYPAQAILDFEECLRKGNIHKDLIESDIVSSTPDAEKYGRAAPDFDFYPEHRNDPEIIDYTNKAKRILREFYDSNWHKTLANDPNFQLAREQSNKMKKNINYNEKKHN